MDTARIIYNEVSDIDTMVSLGIDSVPILSVNGELLSYIDAVKYVNNNGGIK